MSSPQYTARLEDVVETEPLDEPQDVLSPAAPTTAPDDDADEDACTLSPEDEARQEASQQRILQAAREARWRQTVWNRLVFNELGLAALTGDRGFFRQTVYAIAAREDLHPPSSLVAIHLFWLLKFLGKVNDDDRTIGLISALTVGEIENVVFRLWARMPAPSVLRKN